MSKPESQTHRRFGPIEGCDHTTMCCMRCIPVSIVEWCRSRDEARINLEAENADKDNLILARDKTIQSLKWELGSSYAQTRSAIEFSDSRRAHIEQLEAENERLRKVISADWPDGVWPEAITPEAFVELLGCCIADYLPPEDLERLEPGGFFDKWQRRALGPVREIFQRNTQHAQENERLKRELAAKDALIEWCRHDHTYAPLMHRYRQYEAAIKEAK